MLWVLRKLSCFPQFLCGILKAFAEVPLLMQCGATHPSTVSLLLLVGSVGVTRGEEAAFCSMHRTKDSIPHLQKAIPHSFLC